MVSEQLMVSVIIVSYNTRPITLDCIGTLRNHPGDLPVEIWVIDNASGDGTVEAIATAFPDVHLIVNERNVGFGAANNQAIRQARGEFCLLLNSDAFIGPGAIDALLDYLRAHPHVGAVGPRLLNADGSLQRSCFRLPSPTRAWLENLWIADLLHRHPALGEYRRWPHDEERLVEFVSGACIMARRDALLQVGGFDEAFFLYAEETDLQRRMRDRGWQIGFTPSTTVTHLGGASGAGEAVKANRYFFESLDRYVRKHHGLCGVISLRCAMLVGCALRALVWTGVMVCSPGRRSIARAKVRLMTWLLVRQATMWRLPV